MGRAASRENEVGQRKTRSGKEGSYAGRRHPWGDSNDSDRHRLNTTERIRTMLFSSFHPRSLGDWTIAPRSDKQLRGRGAANNEAVSMRMPNKRGKEKETYRRRATSAAGLVFAETVDRPCTTVQHRVDMLIWEAACALLCGIRRPRSLSLGTRRSREGQARERRVLIVFVLSPPPPAQRPARGRLGDGRGGRDGGWTKGG